MSKNLIKEGKNKALFKFPVDDRDNGIIRTSSRMNSLKGQLPTAQMDSMSPLLRLQINRDV